MQQKTLEFKKRVQKGESLEDILPEAFSVVREASLRVNGMRHFDVQLIGAMVLNEGKIAEMRTVLVIKIITWNINHVKHMTYSR